MYFSSLFIIMESLVVAVIKTININIKSRKPYINTINLIFSLMLLEPIQQKRQGATGESLVILGLLLSLYQIPFSANLAAMADHRHKSPELHKTNYQSFALTLCSVMCRPRDMECCQIYYSKDFCRKQIHSLELSIIESLMNF